MNSYVSAMEMAIKIASKSPDPSTQNGAVLVDPHNTIIGPSAACNEFPSGVFYSDDRWKRPLKYALIEHSERGAIYNAARHGIATNGLTLVCPFAACADCARAIACAGIVRLVRHSNTDNTPTRWLEGCAIGDTILKEAGVDIVEVYDRLPGAPAIRRDGKLWQP